MTELANILVVSDLHFGEELLPGASLERKRAIELGVTAFREFLRHHAVRRRDGRPWRLVIAGDLFDFMSVVIAGTKERPAKTRDERTHGLGRSAKTGVLRMRAICEHHRPLLADLAKFAAAGHQVDIVVGNHDVELLAPEVAQELRDHIAIAARAQSPTSTTAPGALDRIKIVPWFVYVPGVAWIEHGHVYDEGCSFEFNLAPMDPKDGNLIYNADYAAVRYLGQAVPEIDPHGIESWGFWGFMQYTMGCGLRASGRIWLAYARFVSSLFRARSLHRSFKRRDRRRREHRARLVDVAASGGISLETANAIDRLARAPLTASNRRVGRLLMLDRFGLILGVAVAVVLMLILLPLLWALAGIALSALAAIGISRWLGTHLVTSQLPMRAIPQRIRRHVDAPVVVFGHTHDPRWQPLRSGGLYVNAGTWLPATKPGLRRSFTHVMIQPRAGGAPPVVELRQWREGGSQPFDARADLGAGVTTIPGFALDDEALKQPEPVPAESIAARRGR
jgi:UDP-2,3-diacylglucosamine pyrophosphatase LpxH